jgi:hypothetical protein
MDTGSAGAAIGPFAYNGSNALVAASLTGAQSFE